MDLSDYPHMINAYRLDGEGGGERLDWEAASAWRPGDGPIWIHLDRGEALTETWLREDSGLNTFVVDGLMANETRPRCEWFDDGVLVILRGVNLNPGAEPEDMVSVRLWLDQERVISTRKRKLMAVDDIREQLNADRGPISTAHLVARLAAQLTDRMGPAVQELSEEVADLEDDLIGSASDMHQEIDEFRHSLVDIRRAAISLSRYVAPQREALSQLSQSDEPWLDKRVRGRFRETLDRVTRLTEDLDSVRERATVVQDELMSWQSQRMERTMYILTLVASVMLPLGFITGLLGINVGGMPGVEAGEAFWIVCGALAVLMVAEFLAAEEVPPALAESADSL